MTCIYLCSCSVKEARQRRFYSWKHFVPDVSWRGRRNVFINPLNLPRIVKICKVTGPTPLSVVSRPRSKPWRAVFDWTLAFVFYCFYYLSWKRVFPADATTSFTPISSAAARLAVASFISCLSSSGAFNSRLQQSFPVLENNWNGNLTDTWKHFPMVAGTMDERQRQLIHHACQLNDP